MSSETDHPRQRTVAELLAEHGAAGASTGRRRRRREPEGDDGEPSNGAASAMPVSGPPPRRASSAPAIPINRGAAPANGAAAPVNGNGVAPAAWAFPPTAPDRPAPDRPAPGRQGLARPGPDRSILREPVPQEPVAREEYVAPDFRPRAYAPDPEPARPAPPGMGRGQEMPPHRLPRYWEERTGVLDPGLTGPIDQQLRPVPSTAPSLDEPTIDSDAGGPATMVGAAPAGAEAWHHSRTRPGDAGGAATQAGDVPEYDDLPAGLGGDIGGDNGVDNDGGGGEIEEPQRRLGRSSGKASPGQAWVAVVAQWIVGAVGGAALWVGFRFLWRELPVVALAAAVLVTVGLVLIVRALLRNSDVRTTVFAVLVGLLLTVSPAILVLLGR